MSFGIETISSFLLVLIRISVLVFMLPFFNSRIFPAQVKAGLALFLSVVLFPVINPISVAFPPTVLELGGIVASEFIIGLVMGLLIQVVFEGIRLMGQVVGFETGFAIANVFDPQSGAQISLLANFSYFISMALFLLFNGHHVLLYAMKESFDLLPIGAITLDRPIAMEMIAISGQMFVIAVKIGAPAIAALLFTKVAFGLISKLIPQMNVMIVAFPVQIGMGLFFFGICLGALLSFMQTYIGKLSHIYMPFMVRLAP